MVGWINNSVQAILNNKRSFVFIKAQASSQIASLADFLVTVVLATVLGWYYVYATFIGALCGGVFNCVINYKWTFQASRVKKRYVAVKYFVVWGSSIALNTAGTYALTEVFRNFIRQAAGPGFLSNNIYIVNKIIVAVLVGILWNYQLQRVFVYSNRSFKQYKYFVKKIIH
jgi:putative flippase GtrA